MGTGGEGFKGNRRKEKKVSEQSKNGIRVIATTHELKCYPIPFQAVVEGLKTFEWRRNDRDFCCGDLLELREYEQGYVYQYTGRKITVKVIYVIYGPDFGIPQGYCIMSIQHLSPQSCYSCTHAGYSGNEVDDCFAFEIDMDPEEMVNIAGTQGEKCPKYERDHRK